MNKTRNNNKSKSWWEECVLMKYLSTLTDEYCKFGSLHGLQYIRDTSIPRIERWFWLVVFLTCLCISGFVVREAYMAGISNEYQLVFDPKSTPLWDIPFPAVLVCSAYPIRKSVFDLEKGADNITFRHFSKMVCPNRYSFESEVFSDVINEQFFEFISSAAIPCRDLIVNCYWGRKKLDCCKLFKPIITHHGLCYVYNSLPGETVYRDYTPPPGVEVMYDDDLMFWDIETGYPSRRGSQAKKVRPQWVQQRGPRGGLTFDLVDLREEWQEICSGPESGFRLYVYPPDGVFEPETYMRIAYNVHTYIKLKPSFINSEESLRSVDTVERKCLFKNEIDLDYFNYYSQTACQLECFTKMSLDRCGCVPFTSRRLVGMFNHRYCNDSSYACLMDTFDNISINSMTASKDNLIQSECVCVPGCFLLEYHFQTSFHKIIDLYPYASWLNNYNKSSQNNIARLSIYFGVQYVNAIKRKKTSDIIKNIGNCGGLLGLLLGFSCMSLLEVIYFAIIRPIKILTFC